MVITKAVLGIRDARRVQNVPRLSNFATTAPQSYYVREIHSRGWSVTSEYDIIKSQIHAVRHNPSANKPSRAHDAHEQPRRGAVPFTSNARLPHRSTAASLR